MCHTFRSICRLIAVRADSLKGVDQFVDAFFSISILVCYTHQHAETYRSQWRRLCNHRVGYGPQGPFQQAFPLQGERRWLPCHATSGCVSLSINENAFMHVNSAEWRHGSVHHRRKRVDEAQFETSGQEIRVHNQKPRFRRCWTLLSGRRGYQCVFHRFQRYVSAHWNQTRFTSIPFTLYWFHCCWPQLFLITLPKCTTWDGPDSNQPLQNRSLK